MATVTLRRALTSVGAVIVSVVLAFATPAFAGTTWLTYHATSSRLGVDPNERTLFPSTQAWRATLDGAVYGQPVVANGLVYAATENNTVYALSAHDGHIVWHRNVGTPLRGVAAAAGCGDIDPLGITSTPVIDPTSGTLYVVAEIASGSGQGAVVHHQMLGLNPSTGAVAVSTNVDPPIGSSAPRASPPCGSNSGAPWPWPTAGSTCPTEAWPGTAGPTTAGWWASTSTPPART